MFTLIILRRLSLQGFYFTFQGKVYFIYCTVIPNGINGSHGHQLGFNSILGAVASGSFVCNIRAALFGESPRASALASFGSI
jgi:hypothetical protein